MTIACNTNTTITQNTDGTYKVIVCANDTLGHLSCDSHNFVISTTAPAVTLIKPNDNSWLSYSTNIYFNFTSIDNNGINTCELWGNWTGSWHKNQSKVFAGDLSVDIAEGSFSINKSDGIYSWNIWCNDTNNDDSWGLNNWTFSIDTISPLLTLSHPQNITYTTNSININFSASDLNRNTCFYNVNNTNNITLSSCSNITFTGNQGSSIFYLFVNDSTNNLNITNITFFIDNMSIDNIPYIW